VAFFEHCQQCRYPISRLVIPHDFALPEFDACVHAFDLPANPAPGRVHQGSRDGSESAIEITVE
jgi:hypothetical protein